VFFYSHANGNNNYYSFFLLPLPKKDCLFSILWAHLTQIKRLLTALTYFDAKIKKNTFICISNHVAVVLLYDLYE